MGLFTLLTAGLMAGLMTAAPDHRAHFRFAGPEEGRAILTQRDAFIQRLSPFDRSARLKSSQPVSEQTFLAHVARSVQSWSAHEQTQVTQALGQIQPRLDALELPWPREISLICSNGQEEGGAAYTRAQAIILPQPVLARVTQPELARLLLHELFHVLTRQNPALKTRLYASIGFRPCGEVQAPAWIQPARITNPDAPVNDYCILLHHKQQLIWAVPLLYAKPDQYDSQRGGEFFDYLQFRLLAIPARQGQEPGSPPQQAGPARLLEVNEVSDFFEQVGHNTDYILHPEEILADNFAILLMGDTQVSSPQVLHKLQEALQVRSKS